MCVLLMLHLYQGLLPYSLSDTRACCIWDLKSPILGWCVLVDNEEPPVGITKDLVQDLAGMVST